VLSVHAAYRCRHSGDCCTSRWPIPIEADSLARVRAAFVNGPRIDDAGELAPAFLPLNERGCAFHDAVTHRCEIHAALGHDALPLACRQFPRVSLTDPRGASVTLSHYCPTALALVDTFDGDIAIVDNAAAFPAAGEYVGLDARMSLPPALCPDVLMDWDSWWEWERLSVELCNLDQSSRHIVERLSMAVELARTWRPAQGGELIDRVREAHEAARTSRTTLTDSTNLTQPDEQTPTNPANQTNSTNRFLASHVFANWTAHLGAGLRTWLRSLETVAFLLDEGWTMREIDLWLRHFADPRLLARVWSAAENEKGRVIPRP
jgi:hypothetical protein